MAVAEIADVCSGTCFESGQMEETILAGLWSRSGKEFWVESESVKMYRIRPHYKILKNTMTIVLTLKCRL
jgi:hypothetical protein